MDSASSIVRACKLALRSAGMGLLGGAWWCSLRQPAPRIWCPLLLSPSSFQATQVGRGSKGLRGVLALGAEMECFASPLNCRYGSFCSAFPDVDAPFGSLGSFFGFEPLRGSFALNPPFVPELIAALAQHCGRLLKQAEETEEALSFVIIVGANESSRQQAASPAQAYSIARDLITNMGLKIFVGI